MEIRANNESGKISASFDFAKKESEQRQDFIYEISSMLACIAGEIADRLEPYQIEKRKDCAVSLFEVAKLMVSEYYDDLVEKTTLEEKQQLAEAGMYAFMEEQYETFLKENGLDEKELLQIVKAQPFDVSVSVQDEAYHFGLSSMNGNAVISTGRVSIHADRYEIETQAMIAAVVVMVLLDRAFGEADPRNVARAKGNIKFYLNMLEQR